MKSTDLRGGRSLRRFAGSRHELADECRIHPDSAATALAIEVTERIADAAAYEREAQRRGVLAL